MTSQELLISHISNLSEDNISSLLDAVTIMLRDKELTPKPACPHCAAQSVIRYGFKCKKQRFSLQKLWAHIRAYYKYHNGQLSLSAFCLERNDCRYPSRKRH